MGGFQEGAGSRLSSRWFLLLAFSSVTNMNVLDDRVCSYDGRL